MRDLAAAASSACCCCSDYLRSFMAIREAVSAAEADFRLRFSWSLPRCITATAAVVAVSKSVGLPLHNYDCALSWFVFTPGVFPFAVAVACCSVLFCTTT